MGKEKYIIHFDEKQMKAAWFSEFYITYLVSKEKRILVRS